MHLRKPRLVPGPATALVTFGAFLSQVCGGCLSNQYVIPQAELTHLAQLPPGQRGRSVQVVQDLGQRRSEAIDMSQPPPPEPYPGEYQGAYGPPEGEIEGGPPVEVGVGVLIAPGPPVGGGPPLPRGGPVRSLPGRPGPVATAPRRVPPVPSHGRRTSSGGSSLGNLGQGGGGGGGKDDLAIFLIVIAALATIGMVATEGARFDGTVAMNPWQPVHLIDESGQEREVPLAQLTPAEAAWTSKALVMDDEGWGMMRLRRRPLDRHGFAFKMDGGLFHSSCSCLTADGAGTNVQFGYFPYHRFGLLATWAFAGGSDANAKSFYRNNLALEAQIFPLDLWRLHLGGFAHAGVQYADDDQGGSRSGPAFGGGALLELELTTRLAFTLRADYTTAKLAGPAPIWAGTELFTAGFAVY